MALAQFCKLNIKLSQKVFRIRISQLISKLQLKQQSLNQIRHCVAGHNQI